MLSQLLQRPTNASPSLLVSRQYDEKTLYPAFIKDLNNCGCELIIESFHYMQASHLYLARASKAKGS